MDFLSICRHVISLDQQGVTDEDTWGGLRSRFCKELKAQTDPSILETAVLQDSAWEIPVDLRTELLLYAKESGAGSSAFLLDYYGFLSMHMDPGEEQEAMKATFDAL